MENAIKDSTKLYLLYNTNLAQRDSGLLPNLKDNDTLTCEPVTSVELDWSDQRDTCSENGVCRVNYLLLYLKDNQNELPTKLQKVKWRSGHSEIQYLGSALTISEANVTIPSDYMFTGMTLEFSESVELCEVVVAGTSPDDYDCSAGRYRDGDTCQYCTRGTASPEPGAVGSCGKCPENTISNKAFGSNECTPCPYLEYSGEGSTTCTPCTTETSAEPRCYYSNGNHINLVKESVFAAEVISFEHNTAVESSLPNNQPYIDLGEDVAIGYFVTTVVFIFPPTETGTAKAVGCTEVSSTSENLYVANCTGLMLRRKEGTRKVDLVLETPDGSGEVKVLKVFVFGSEFKDASVPEGYELSSDGDRFEQCAVGHYSPGGVGAKCSPCPANQYQSVAGKAQCENCGEQQYSKEGAAVCSQCPETQPDGSVVDNDVCKGAAYVCTAREEESRYYGSYTWPTTPVGATAKLPCVHNNGDYATRVCNDMTNEFESTDFSACESGVTRQLDDIEQLPVEDVDDAVRVSTQVRDLSRSKSDEMDDRNVEQVSGIIDSLVDNIGESEQIRDNLLNTVDSVHEGTDEEQLSADKGKAAKMMRESAKKLSDQMGQGNSTYVTAKTVSMAVAEPGKDTTTTTIRVTGTGLEDLSGSSTSGNESAIFTVSVPNEEEKKVTAVLYDPSAKFYPSEGASSNINNTFRENFKSDPSKVVRAVSSLVTEISYADSSGSVSFQNNQKIKLAYSVQDHNPAVYYKMAITKKYECAFYNVTTGEWRVGEESGCETAEDKETGRVTCTCDHMTSFAVLMTMSSDYDEAEDIVSQVLLAISLGCLFCTVIAYLPAKEMLKTRTVRINLLLVTSMIFAIIIFHFMDLVAKERAESETQEGGPSVQCLAVAFLMNYFWLCQMAWMVCEAVVMYRALVSCVLNSHISRYMLKFNLACWGIPLIFPIIGVAWGQDKFANADTCFIDRPFGFVSFYGPVVLCICFNIFIFVRVLNVFRSKNNMGHKVPASDLERRKKQFNFAVSVMSLLGVSWIFGFCLIFEQANQKWLRYIFIILNSTQGILIFVLYVILNDNLKKVWLKLLGMSDGDKPTSSSVPYSRSKVPQTKHTFATSAALMRGTTTESEQQPSSRMTMVTEYDRSRSTTPKSTTMMTGLDGNTAEYTG